MLEKPMAVEKKHGVLKYEEASREGTCQECTKPYKTGERIALYVDEESAKDDVEAGLHPKPSPYHPDCLNDAIDRKVKLSEEEKPE